MVKRGKGVVIDDNVFQHRARKLARLYKVEENQFVREQTALLARDVAKYTPPFDEFPRKGRGSIGTGKDKKAGLNSLDRDINYITTVQKMGAIKWALKTFGAGRPILKGRKEISKGVLTSVSELRRWHQKNRSARRGRTEPLQHDQKYWVSEQIVGKYKKAESLNVGLSKAAFAKAAMQLGSKAAVPVWVKRNLGRVSGRGKTVRTSSGSHGLIDGKAPGLAHVKRLLPMIEADRLIKATKRLRILKRDVAKKSWTRGI